MLLIGENGVHALTLYSFISVYLLAAIIIEQLPESKMKLFGKDVVVVTLATIIMCNIYSANKVYLKQYLIYQNSFAFYEQIITQVEMTPGFDENSKLAIVGNVERDSEYLDNFGEDSIYGLCGFKSAAISDEFILQYIGFNAKFASAEEVAIIQEDDCFKKMPVYPYYGYVQKIDDYIVVKLGK